MTSFELEPRGNLWNVFRRGPGKGGPSALKLDLEDRHSLTSNYTPKMKAQLATNLSRKITYARLLLSSCAS